MKLNTEYREYKKQDRKRLRKLLAGQIYNEFFENEKDAERYSGFILKKIAKTCRYKRVVVVGGQVAGAIFGMKKTRNRFLMSFWQKIFFIRLGIKRKNRKALKCLSLLDGMEQEILTQNQVDIDNLIVLLLLEKRHERAEIQEELLREWKSRNGERNTDFYVVVYGRIEPGFPDKYCFRKEDEKFVMIQPKEQRFRFYETLYRSR